MRVLASVAALAALAFAQSAAAATVTLGPIAFAPEFQPKLEEEIGVAEAPYLQRQVDRSVTTALNRSGVEVGPGGDVTLEVTVLDADPNKPTMLELRNQPGLDWGRSVSIGGAELHGVLRGADGRVLAEVDHDYYSPSIEDVYLSAGEWTDANRAIRRFASKVADAYVANAR